MSSYQSRPVFARKFGRTFDRLDALSAESLCYRELGKVNVDCKFRSSDSIWGVLGETKRPAGILYMDFTFDQPKNYRLSSAKILVTLQDCESPPQSTLLAAYKGDEIMKRPSGPLRVTNHFGPRKITGEPKTMSVTSKINATPNINIWGNGVGGMGLDTEKSRTYVSRWIFDGKIIPGERIRNGPKGSTYRTLKWDLSENDLDLGVEHSNEIHTGFAFEHSKQPCYLKVEISGKLQKMRHRIKHQLKFPPNHRKDQGEALTWMGLSKTDHFKTRLDPIADSLSRDLEMKNYAEIPVQLPDALPASFNEVPRVGQSDQPPSSSATTLLGSISSLNTNQRLDEITSAPAIGLLDQASAPLDPMAVFLGRGSVVFGGPAGVRQSINQQELQHQSSEPPSTSQRKFANEDRVKSLKVREAASREAEETEDAEGRRTALLPIFMLFKFLASFLDFIGQKSILTGGSRGEGIEFVIGTTSKGYEDVDEQLQRHQLGSQLDG
jgi:hypothetical protein